MQMSNSFHIFWIFLRLGCISFGGPAAHLVFFHQTFVIKKKWLTESEYSQIVALTQLLPGPSSSQTGIALGYLRHGYSGAFAAWLGFTLPSTIFMTACGLYFQSFRFNLDAPIFQYVSAIICAIICFAFWQMLKSYCSTKVQYIFMFTSTMVLLLLNSAWSQIIIILVSIVFGVIYSLKTQNYSNTLSTTHQSNALLDHLEPPFAYLNTKGKQYAYLWFYLFISLFSGLYLIRLFSDSDLINFIFSFYSTGSLVFGGGHVIFPLLEQQFVFTQQLSSQQFELGYALAQLLPGPLFTFSAYIGIFIPTEISPTSNAIIAVLAIFLPSFFLVFATLPYWNRLLSNVIIAQSVGFINAAVTGFLLAMLIPMTIKSLDNILNILCFSLLLMCLYFKFHVFKAIAITLSIILSLDYIFQYLN